MKTADTISAVDVRYRGEIADMNLIRRVYQVNDYIEAIEDRDRAAGEHGEDLILLAPVAEREIFPRLYRVVDRVQERLGISFPYEVRLLKSRVDVAMVAKKTGPEELVLQFAVSPEDIATFDDEELAFKFGSCLGWEVWGFGKFTNLERRAGATDGGDEYGDDESVLPMMGNHLYKQWKLKAKLSADRMGAIAAGGFEAGVKTLLREDSTRCVNDGSVRLTPLRTEDMCIPGIGQFREFEERRGKPKPDEELLYRIRALCIFCDRWFAPGCDRRKLDDADDILDNDFAEIARKIDTPEERDMVLSFVSLALQMLCVKGRTPSRGELRVVVSTLYKDHTDRPEEILGEDCSRIISNGKTAFRRLVRRDLGFRLGVYSDLCEVAAVDGRNAEAKKSFLTDVAKKMGIADIATTALMLNAISEAGEAMVDPLADALVTEIKAKLDGRAIKRKMAGKQGRVLGVGPMYRYAGDIEDEHTIRNVYNVDPILKSWTAEFAKDNTDEVRNDSLKEGIRLTSRTSPRLARIVKTVIQRLGIDFPIEVVCRREWEINAHAKFVQCGGRTWGLVTVSAETVERLDDDELASVIGHEIGHIIHRHLRWAPLEKDDENGRVMQTVLPQMGNNLYLEWQQKQEISADRVGAIAAGNAKSALSGLVKVCYGLSPENFDIGGVDQLLEQIREIKDGTSVYDSVCDTHPLSPLRIKAMKLFCDVYYSPGCSPDKVAEVDRKIAGYYEWIRKYPRTTCHLASMRAYATAGMEMLLADGPIEESEISAMCRVLNSCTYDPLAEFKRDAAKRKARLASAVKVLKEENDDDINRRLVEHLAVLALSDGAISEKENRYIVRFAKRIGIDEEDSRKMISAKVAEVGFPIDWPIESQVDRLMKIVQRT